MRLSGKTWTEDEIKSLELDYKNYLPKNLMVNKYNRSWSAITTKVYEQGFTRDYPTTHSRYKLPITRKEIALLYNSGKSIQELAQLCGCGVDNILVHLKKQKVIFRPRKEPANKLHLPHNEITRKYLMGQSMSDMAKYYKCSIHTIWAIIPNNLIRRTYCKLIKKKIRKEKYRLNEKFLDIIDSEEKAYFLGLMYADGNVSNDLATCRLRLQVSDIDILTKLSNIIQSNRKISISSRNNVKCKPVAELAMYNKHFAQNLISYGCVPNKTFKITFPEWLREDLQRHFIRGYFDGDGCISVSNKRSPSFHLIGTEQFLSRVQEIMMKELGLNKTVLHDRFPERNTNIRSMNYGGRFVCVNIRNWLYKDATLFLARKHEKFNTISDAPRVRNGRPKGSKNKLKRQILKELAE